MPSLWPVLPGVPEGLRYVPDFLTEADHDALVAQIERLPFREVHMHGVVAKRTVIHYGYDYGYDSWQITPTDPLPDFLVPFRARAAAEAGVDAARLAQVLIARYPSGAGIGWHRDAPMFGEPVVGISLAGATVMRFRRGPARGRETYPLVLAPRSLYILNGPARRDWQHGIAGQNGLRYSVTFRTVRAR
jgi:alkylated DNA repair dioxygenase AlkB